jgi:hypothetical protein
MPESALKPSFFEREDDAPDSLFYREPRLLVHIDSYAIKAARRLYAELLPPGGAVLDLMSSYRSHMPESLGLRRLAGVGLNDVEMRENPQLTDHVVHEATLTHTSRSRTASSTAPSSPCPSST